MFNNDTETAGTVVVLSPFIPFWSTMAQTAEMDQSVREEAVVDTGDMLLGKVSTVLSLYSLPF